MKGKREIRSVVLVVVLGLTMIYNVSAGTHIWTPLGGPTITGGSVAALVVHPTVPGVLYAIVNPPGSESMYFGSMGGVFKTTDGGQNWTAVYKPPTKLQALAITDTLIYGGGWGHSRQSSIYRSTDEGVNWEEVYTTNRNWNSIYALTINRLICPSFMPREWKGLAAIPTLLMV